MANKINIGAILGEISGGVIIKPEDPITNITKAIVNVIKTITVENGYNFTWGTSNVWCEAQKEVIIFPNAVIHTDEGEVGEDSDTWSEVENLVIIIDIEYRLDSEIENKVYASKPYYHKCLKDLKKAFNTNYTLNNTCDIIKYKNFKMDKPASNDALIPNIMQTYWDVQYQYLYDNPMVRR